MTILCRKELIAVVKPGFVTHRYQGYMRIERRVQLEGSGPSHEVPQT